MDIKKVERELAKKAVFLKKEFSGSGPISLKVTIKGNTVKLNLVAEFDDLQYFLLYIIHRLGVVEPALKIISEEVMKPQFDPVFKEYDSELEIIEITTVLSGEKYSDQLTIMILNKDFEQIIIDL